MGLYSKHFPGARFTVMLDDKTVFHADTLIEALDRGALALHWADAGKVTIFDNEGKIPEYVL